MAHGSRKAVITALFANMVLTVLKFIAAVFSHSASMMNEAIHSLMDSLNQAFLLLGLNVARRPAGWSCCAMPIRRSCWARTGRRKTAGISSNRGATRRFRGTTAPGSC